MSTEESNRIERAAEWYAAEQLELDKRLLIRRYAASKPYFVGSSCLELGPAEGLMTARLVSDFSAVTVVDGSAVLLSQIPDRENLIKIHSLFEDFKPAAAFDTVIVDHVLEHVEHPVQLIRSALDWVAPGGRLIVGVPNANSIHRLAAVKLGMLRHQTSLNERDLALGHRRVYTSESLSSDLNSAGAEILHLGGVFLKVLSNRQLQNQWTPELIDAFMDLGTDYPEISAEIFAICVPSAQR